MLGVPVDAVPWDDVTRVYDPRERLQRLRDSGSDGALTGGRSRPRGAAARRRRRARGGAGPDRFPAVRSARGLLGHRSRRLRGRRVSQGARCAVTPSGRPFVCAGAPPRRGARGDPRGAPRGHAAVRRRLRAPAGRQGQRGSVRRPALLRPLREAPGRRCPSATATRATCRRGGHSWRRGSSTIATPCSRPAATRCGSCGSSRGGMLPTSVRWSHSAAVSRTRRESARWVRARGALERVVWRERAEMTRLVVGGQSGDFLLGLKGD